jgi:hypothetical protein
VTAIEFERIGDSLFSHTLDSRRRPANLVTIRVTNDNGLATRSQIERAVRLCALAERMARVIPELVDLVHTAMEISDDDDENLYEASAIIAELKRRGESRT